MLERERNIPELYDLKHRNDNQENKPYNVEDNILKRSLSPHIYNNDKMNDFLLRLQRLSYLIIDQMSIMKNFKNFMVGKYHDDHVD
jgi:hypothetical protein